MAKIISTERFVKDLARVYSENVYKAIKKSVSMLEILPEIGSRNIPISVEEEFGSNLRKLIVAPFDIFYEYDENTDVVTLDTIVRFRQAR